MRYLSRLATGAIALACAAIASATPPTPERVAELCAQVESPAHCGRMIEAEQLKSLPSLATRNGDTLNVTLFPSGTRAFVDSIASSSEKSYALWDYWSPINTVVLFVTSGENITYTVLQRATGAVTALPAEPMLGPDRQRVAVADFCPKLCTNEITVWRVTREGLRKEMRFKPDTAWSDVNVAWKDEATLVFQYTPAGEATSRTLERKLTAPEWQRT